MLRSIQLLFVLFFVANLSAQTTLELDKIMAGNDFIGHQPYAIQWSPTSQEIYFKWKHERELIDPYYVYSLNTKTYRKLSSSEAVSLPVSGHLKNNKSSVVLFSSGNKLLIIEKNQPKEIFSKYSQFSVLDHFNSIIILQEQDNLFSLDISNGTYKQLTNFVKGNRPGESKQSGFLIEQQSELFETIRSDQKKSVAKSEYGMVNKDLTKFYLEGKSISWIQVNQNFTHALFSITQYPDEKYTHIERYITRDGYSSSRNARAKVGSPQPLHELYVWDLVNDSILSLTTNNLSGIYNPAEFLAEYDSKYKTEKLANPKSVIYHEHGFSDDGTKFLVELKSYDNKDRWLCYYDCRNNQLTEFNHQHDEKWIGGPGISGWKSQPGNLGWITNNSVYFQSEETGYSHLYMCDLTANKANQFKQEQLTAGEFEIHEAQLSKDHSKFFVTANKTHPGNRDFYLLDIKTKTLTSIITLEGNSEVAVSPDEKSIAIMYSSKNKPWELYVAPLKENAILTRVTKSTTQEFESYAWRSPQVITYKASDEVSINARLYEPIKEKKNGAGIIFVHGAGYLQNAHNWWSTYYREYMFHNLLADKGFTILDIDYRASEGYGRDFRTGIYRHMGGKDLSDQLDGRKYLIEKLGIDSTRIGIYGGSYGGFITLMAMLTEPGKFKCGAALRSVTDWAHYNHDYTANILNTPEEDPIAFKRSSPIYFADGLVGRLLMLHGIEDDNVQYQDVVRLSQRFIELKKKNWDLIGYPIEPHSFVETTSWIDEYGRILKMFEEELIQ